MFRNVPTARRSRSTSTPWIVGEYRKVFGSVGRENLADGHFLRPLKRSARKDTPGTRQIHGERADYPRGRMAGPKWLPISECSDLTGKDGGISFRICFVP